MKPRLIIFDFDGTIAATLEVALEVVNGFAEKYGFKVVAPEEVESFRNLRTREIVAKLGIKARRIPKLVIDVRRELRSRMDEIELFEGVPDALRALRDTDVRVGILTSNAEENVAAVLDRAQLGDCFDFVRAGSSLFGKARMLRRIHESYGEGCAAEQVIYVGDETRDVHAAQSAGFRSVAVTWGLNTEEVLVESGPDHLIAKPSELLELTIS